jgi:shikimate kinase
VDRVKNRKNRPLLSNKNLKDNLLSLKEIRDPIYKKISNYIIDVSGKERDQVINEIQKII